MILSIMIGAFIIGGASFSFATKGNSDSKVINVAGGEKEPKLFSTYSASVYSYEL